MIKNNNNSIGIDNRVSLPFPFATNRAFPLDSRSFFSDFIEAQDKVRDAVPLLRYGNVFELPAEIDAENQEHGTDDWYYYGQPVVVYNDDTGQSDLYLVVRRIDETTGEPYGDLRLVCDSLDTQYLSLDDASAYITQVILQWVGENLNTEDCITGYLFTCATDDCENNIPLNGLYAFGLKEEGGIIGLCDDYNQILWFDPETVYDRNTNQLATLESINNRISNARVVFKNCNGAVVGSFTLNQASEQDIVITLPSGGGGTSNYEGLENKPSINGVELSGNLTNEDLHIGAVEIEYQDLVTLRNNGGLVPGTWYRITDYHTTVSPLITDVRSADHQFDIIVRADDASHLNESGYAAHHEGDEYFAACKLEAWELQYRLDNEKWSRVAGTYIEDDGDGYHMKKLGTVEVGGETYILWDASEYTEDYGITRTVSEDDEVGTELNEYNPETGEILYDGWSSSIASKLDVEGDGQGTILMLKDEYGNQCPYDFKSIQFKRWAVTDSQQGRDGLDGNYMGALNYLPQNISIEDETDFVWAYTFSSDATGSVDQVDFSLDGTHYVYGNVLEMAPHAMNDLNNVVFYGEYNYCNHLDFDCYCNTFWNGCMYNTFGNGFYNNTFGNSCYKNSFGNNCYQNSFGNNCNTNSFGNYCNTNSFGNYFQNNTFGNSCQNNSLGNDCDRNSFGNSCQNNSFGNSCFFNTFNNNCKGNLLGNNCQYNSLEENCSFNSLGNSCFFNSFGSYCRYLTVFDNVLYCNITGGTSPAPVKNAQILNGTAGASAQNKLTITFAANQNYTQVAAKNTQGNLVIFNPADSAS